MGSLWEMGMMPFLLTSPTVGLIPTTPHVVAGQTMEPSSPRAARRVSPEEELEGLDKGEHGMEAYPGFTQATPAIHVTKA